MPLFLSIFIVGLVQVRNFSSKQFKYFAPGTNCLFTTHFKITNLGAIIKLKVQRLGCVTDKNLAFLVFVNSNFQSLDRPFSAQFYQHNSARNLSILDAAVDSQRSSEIAVEN